jgi:hypothetical protein
MSILTENSLKSQGKGRILAILRLALSRLRSLGSLRIVQGRVTM